MGAGCDGRGDLRCNGLISKEIKIRTPDDGKPRTAKSCGPGAATLALPAGACSRTTGARKAASPGRARISRKTIARGRPGCLGCTCQNRVHSFSSFSTRRCGRSQRPAFPAPSLRRGSERNDKTRAKARRGNAFGCLKTESANSVHLAPLAGRGSRALARRVRGLSASPLWQPICGNSPSPRKNGERGEERPRITPYPPCSLILGGPCRYLARTRSRPKCRRPGEKRAPWDR